MDEKRVLPPPIPEEPPLEVIPVRRRAPLPTPREGPLLDRLTGVMRHIREDVNVAPRSPTTPRVEVAPARRAECAELLRELSQAHAAAARPPGGVGAAWMGAGAFVGGGLLGWLTEEAYCAFKGAQTGSFSLLDGGPVDAGAVGRRDTRLDPRLATPPCVYQRRRRNIRPCRTGPHRRVLSRRWPDRRPGQHQPGR